MYCRIVMQRCNYESDVKHASIPVCCADGTDYHFYQCNLISVGILLVHLCMCYCTAVSISFSVSVSLSVCLSQVSVSMSVMSSCHVH